jgi:hypothetical protein
LAPQTTMTIRAATMSLKGMETPDEARVARRGPPHDAAVVRAL